MFKEGDRVMVKDTCTKKDWVGLELEITMPHIRLTYSGGIVAFAKKKNGTETCFFLEDLELLN